MRFDIMTLFPEMVTGVLNTSITGRAIQAGVIEVSAHNIRDHSEDKHRRVDDTPYGGGFGMVMAAPPICACFDSIPRSAGRVRTIYMSPKGKVLTQKKAAELSRFDQLIILCGHYEGVDERAIEEICDEEISIGDYILTGGELAACVLVDCVSRLIDGVLADEKCHTEETVSCGMLEYPQYTRPPVFRGREVPGVLMSGNHEEVERWRYGKALEDTLKKRKDLIY